MISTLKYYASKFYAIFLRKFTFLCKLTRDFKEGEAGLSGGARLLSLSRNCTGNFWIIVSTCLCRGCPEPTAAVMAFNVCNTNLTTLACFSKYTI